MALLLHHPNPLPLCPQKEYTRSIFLAGELTVAQNFSPHQRPRRQEWAGELCENGMFYIARVEVIKRGLLQGNRCGYVEVPLEDSLDIDTPFDGIVAQAWINYCREGPM